MARTKQTARKTTGGEHAIRIAHSIEESSEFLFVYQAKPPVNNSLPKLLARPPL
jgi:hypothetical protein